MTLSESIAALVSQGQVLIPQVAAVEAKVGTLTNENETLNEVNANLITANGTVATERDAAVEALDVLMILAQAYLDSPNGADADEADALTAFLAAHSPTP